LRSQLDRYVGDGTYDTKGVYDAIEKHNQDGKIVIPPRESAVGLCQLASRKKSFDIIEEHGRGAWCNMRKYGL
jgi:hypothetical protein